MTVAANSLPQFNRSCRVTIGGPVTPNDQSLGAHFLDAVDSSRQVLIVNGNTGGLRIKFKAEWQLNNWTPNIGYCEIYNLSKEHRQFCNNPMTPVVIEAGYGGDLVLVATINAVQVNHKHDGPDWITKLEGGDGGRAFASAHISKSFAAGTPMANVAQQLGGLLGKMGAGSQATLQAAAAGKTFKNGYAVHGSPVRDFRSILRDLGLEYTVQNEEIIIAKRNETTQQVFVVSPQSGLVGSFEYATPPQPGKPHQLKGKILMNPLIRPGARIIVQTASHSGPYRCMTVGHEGDTYGNPWYTNLTIQGLQGAT